MLGSGQFRYAVDACYSIMVLYLLTLRQYALVFMPGLVFGRLFDMGYLRLPVAAASVLLVLCTFLTAECTEYWHFLLCQGFGIGVRFIATHGELNH